MDPKLSSVPVIQDTMPYKRLGHSLSSNVGDGDRLGEPVNYCQEVGVTFAEGQGPDKVEVHSIKPCIWC